MTWKSTALSLLEPFGTLVFRRVGTPNVDITVRARLRGYRAEEIVGGVQQGDRQVIAYGDDVTFDPPLRTGDKVFAQDGRMLNIETVDGSTGITDEGLVVYYLRVRG
jgi:hypothetical protein